MNRTIGTLEYDYFMRFDKWSKKDAALIISGFNPEHFRDLQLGVQADIPEHLVQAHLLYRVFISINFRTTYQELDTNPLAYIAECVRKEWPIAEPLLDLAKQRYHKEYPHLTYGSLGLLRDSNVDCDDEKAEPTSKEMNYLSKVLGVMVMLYVSEQDNGQKYGKTSKSNVSAIVEKVLQFMQENDWDIYGLRKSNLHKKINQALSHVLREVG